MMGKIQRMAQATGRGVKSLTTLLKSELLEEHHTTSHTQPEGPEHPGTSGNRDKPTPSREPAQSNVQQTNHYTEADDDYV